MNKCELVRSSCKYIMQHATHIKINSTKFPSISQHYTKGNFNAYDHHKTSDDPQKALLQLFILDFLNFCFWPLPNFQYQHLAKSVQQSIQNGLTLLDLSSQPQDYLLQKIFGGVQVPLASSRIENLKELGSVVHLAFGGSLCKLVKSANASAVELLQILTSSFPNLQDHSIYKGKQVHFYKRAQILIGDIWGSFKGQGLGHFSDIDQLTMFPDYRVPQILETYQVLLYSPQLKQAIQNQQVIYGEMECEVRAAAVIGVQSLKEYMGNSIRSIDLDWFLWEFAEKNLSKMNKHHRSLTIYY